MRISQEFLLEIFWFFFHEVTVPSNLKSYGAWFFEKKIILRFSGQKRQNEAFQVSSKFMHKVSLIFWHEDTVEWALKIDLNGFAWEKYCFEAFGLKGPRNGFKKKFFKFYEKPIHRFFLISCMKLGSHLTWKVMEQDLLQNISLLLILKKFFLSKKPFQNEDFQVLSKIIAWHFSGF